MYNGLPLPEDAERMAAARARIAQLHPTMCPGAAEDMARQLAVNPAFDPATVTADLPKR